MYLEENDILGIELLNYCYEHFVIFKGNYLQMDRQKCDDEFFQMMLNTCYSQTSFDRGTCLYWARGYFDAVSSYGESHYIGNNDCCKATAKLAPEGK